MKIKKVVFLRSNPVDPDSRVEKEVESLVKAGYQVDILAWDRSKRYKINESYINFTQGRARIYRFGIPASYGEGIKNIKAFMLFQFSIYKWLLKNKRNFQLIHACDFDTAFTAYQFSRMFKKKLVFDIFDFLFTDNTGKFRFFKNLIVNLQLKIVNFADGTIICTEKRKEQIKGARPKELVVIHNSPPVWNKSIGNSINSEEKRNERVKIAYVGILQDGRFLKELGELVKNDKQIELHIGGFGKYEDYFENLSNKCANIFYYGKLPYHKTLELESNCDIMTAIYDPFIVEHHFAAPNKFYEALMLGKPLIMAKNTGMSDVVLKHNIGELMDFNTESLKSAIKKISNRKDEWSNISRKMKRLYEDNYSWEEMDNRLVEFYKKL